MLPTPPCATAVSEEINRSRKKVRQVRRIVMGFYYAWRTARKNKRQSTLKDFHDTMDHHRHREAWRLLQT